MLQLVILAALVLVAVAPVQFAVSLARFLIHRTDARSLIRPATFLAGFMLTAWIIWRTAVPEGWTLPFWSTLQAAIDSDTYGHPVEHAAEQLAGKVIVLGTAGGALIASVCVRFWPEHGAWHDRPNSAVHHGR